MKIGLKNIKKIRFKDKIRIIKAGTIINLEIFN
jgi:hypothetical protein